MKKRNLLYTAFVCGALCLFRCTFNPVADGSGSDVGNGNVIGFVYTPDGKPSSNTQVRLVPDTYNPGNDAPLPDSLIDTTNGLGMYTFAIAVKGAYNVEAVHLQTRARLLLKGVTVQSSADTVIVPFGIIRQPGAVKIFLPDTTDTADGYVFVLGTTVFKKLSHALSISSSRYPITLDSVPEATINGILFGRLNNPQNPITLTDTLTVLSSKITEIDGFVFWTNYTTANSMLPGNKISDICRDAFNRVWIATAEGGVAVYNGTVWEVYNTGNSSLPSNNVQKIKYLANNTLWFATDGGVAAYNGTQWISYTTANSGIPTNRILDVDEDSKGNKWFGTRDTGLVMFDGTTWTVLDSATSKVPHNTVVAVQVTADDTVWCATPNGVLAFKDSYFHFMNSSNSGLLSNDIYCMLIETNGKRWFGRQGGVSLYNQVDSTWTHYNVSTTFIFRDSVFTIAKDTKGVVWFGTTLGITTYDGVSWFDYSGSRYPMLDNRGVQAICFDILGSTWIGTSKNGIVAFRLAKK